MLFYGVLGAMLGGRLGYVLFYKFYYYLANPIDILKVWQGGMTFHGGFLGVLIAMWCFPRIAKNIGCSHRFHRTAGAARIMSAGPRQFSQW